MGENHELALTTDKIKEKYKLAEKQLEELLSPLFFKEETRITVLAYSANKGNLVCYDGTGKLDLLATMPSVIFVIENWFCSVNFLQFYRLMLYNTFR